MSNELSVYDPLFYSQEAIIQLHKNLGMAARVHRGYDKAPQQKGSVISISRPSTFTALAAPQSAQAINAGEVQITLDQWYEVKFKLTDKELTYTTEKIITDHIVAGVICDRGQDRSAVSPRFTRMFPGTTQRLPVVASPISRQTAGSSTSISLRRKIVT
jgi:hypothetical protein